MTAKNDIQSTFHAHRGLLFYRAFTVHLVLGRYDRTGVGCPFPKVALNVVNAARM